MKEMTDWRSCWVAPLVISALAMTLVPGQETLPPLAGGSAPQSFEELWVDFDPRAEPLDVEILKEWEEEDVVMRILRYRVGIFKGRKSMMAAVYGFPKGRNMLPGLVQIHGGGQYADSNAVLTNAKRGYATISIAWAGRIKAPGYRVGPKEVKLFWDDATNDPSYKLTTDWGALDAYHAPSRNPGNSFPSLPVGSWTLDSVESPRNNGWFLCVLGARRALTFLEQQPEVDGERLGVYGHSMGGKLTVLTAGADSRVKAAAPSCGGISDRDNKSSLFRATIGDDAYLRNITCPIVFLSPANDFHGRIGDLQSAVTEIGSDEWRVSCSPHHNHQDTPRFEVATQLWFDQHLKGVFRFPETPQTRLELKNESGIPVFTVLPDYSKQVLSVDVFFTRHGRSAETNADRENTMHRFWHHAAAVRVGDSWSADLPLANTEMPLWVYANVTYPLEHKVTGAGYYYRTYATDQFNLSSLMSTATPGELKTAGVKPMRQPSHVIEAFEGDWEKEWFSYRPEDWACRTNKLHDARWAAPDDAKLGIDVRSSQPNKLVIGIDSHAAEVQLKGAEEWQSVVVASSAFKSAGGESLPGWEGVMELRLGADETLREKKPDRVLRLGGPWQGGRPEFRNLRWIEVGSSE